MDCSRKRRRDRSVCSSAMVNLPSHILMDIISRLPIKTVMAVTCVCKSLLELVSGPCFKDLYSTTAPTEVFLLRSFDHGNTLYNAEPVFQDCSSLAVDVKFTHVFGLSNFSALSKNDVNFRPTKSHVRLVNTCNGLVCYRGPFAVICNPVTGEYVTIPGPGRKDKTIHSQSISYGLGFSSKDNRFKLLRLLWRRNVDAGPVIGEPRFRMFSEIYTFGENGSWKSVANCPDVHVSYLSKKCTFCEGVLHWYSYNSCDILTFDFDSEEFGKINSPYSWAQEMEYGDFTRLGVLGGCLYKTASVGDCVEVWVMKEYGVQSSWIKAFSIQKDIWYLGQSYEPIKYLQNGEILMLSAHAIVCYNPDTGSIRIIGSSGDLGCEAISMRPSLVSLKLLLGDNVKPRNAKSRLNTRQVVRRFQEHAHRNKEELAHRDPEVYLRQTDFLQRQIQNLTKLLHLCGDIPPRTAAEPPLAATDLTPDANSN